MSKINNKFPSTQNWSFYSKSEFVENMEVVLVTSQVVEFNLVETLKASKAFKSATDKTVAKLGSELASTLMPLANDKSAIIFSSVCGQHFTYIPVEDLINKFIANSKVYKAGENGLGIKLTTASKPKLVEVV